MNNAIMEIQQVVVQAAKWTGDFIVISKWMEHRLTRFALLNAVIIKKLVLKYAIMGTKQAVYKTANRIMDLFAQLIQLLYLINHIRYALQHVEIKSSHQMSNATMGTK